MEKMSEKELELLRSLQAKQKRIRRAENEFYQMLKSRQKEVFEYLDISSESIDRMKRLSAIASVLGTSDDEALDALERFANAKAAQYGPPKVETEV